MWRGHEKLHGHQPKMVLNLNRKFDSTKPMQIGDLVGYPPFDYGSSDTEVDIADVTKSRFVGKTEENSHQQPDPTIAAKVSKIFVLYTMFAFYFLTYPNTKFT